MDSLWLGIPAWKWFVASSVMTGRLLFFGLVPAYLLLKSGNAGLNRAPLNARQFRRELGYGLLAVVIQILSFYQLRCLVRWGISHLYVNPLEYGFPYLFFQIPLFLIFVDGAFYALHRWMHTPFMLRNFHHVHHRSRDINPLTNFSMHPLEAFFQVSIGVLATILFPVNEVVITVLGLLLIAQNFYLHSARELYPRNWLDRPLLRWLATSTFHHQHHTHPNSNYGVYLRFWDSFFHTEHPEYISRFKEVKK